MSLDHPNIIRLSQTFQDKNNYYFMMEYAPNGTLARMIRKIGKFPVELARYYSAQMVLALELL